MKRKFLFAILIAILFVVFLGLWVLFSEKGSRTAVEFAASRYVEDDNFRFDTFSGDLMAGLTIENLRLTNIKDLPPESELKIQRLYAKIGGLGAKNLELEIENARLRLPDSSPIVLRATVREQAVDANVFSSGIYIGYLFEYVPFLKKHLKTTSSLGKIDLSLTGTMEESALTGFVEIEKLVTNKAIYKGEKLEPRLTIRNILSDPQVSGYVALSGGEIRLPKSSITVESGRITFDGLLANPYFDIKARSRIDKTDIHIHLKGTREKPDLVVTSTPPRKREVLLLMLATGKSWKVLEGEGKTGELSADLASDFLDYFFFTGEKNGLAKKLGLSELTFEVDGKTTGVAAKKNITDQLEVGYGIEQKKKTDEPGQVNHKIQSEYDVTDKVSVGVERKIKGKQENEFIDEVNKDAVPEDKVYIEYKTKF